MVVNHSLFWVWHFVALTLVTPYTLQLTRNGLCPSSSSQECPKRIQTTFNKPRKRKGPYRLFILYKSRIENLSDLSLLKITSLMFYEFRTRSSGECQRRCFSAESLLFGDLRHPSIENASYQAPPMPSKRVKKNGLEGK